MSILTTDIPERVPGVSVAKPVPGGQGRASVWPILRAVSARQNNAFGVDFAWRPWHQSSNVGRPGRPSASVTSPTVTLSWSVPAALQHSSAHKSTFRAEVGWGSGSSPSITSTSVTDFDTTISYST